MNDGHSVVVLHNTQKQSPPTFGPFFVKIFHNRTVLPKVKNFTKRLVPVSKRHEDRGSFTKE